MWIGTAISSRSDGRTCAISCRRQENTPVFYSSWSPWRGTAWLITIAERGWKNSSKTSWLLFQHPHQLVMRYELRYKLGHSDSSPWPQRYQIECVMTLLTPFVFEKIVFSVKKWNMEYIQRPFSNFRLIRTPGVFVKTQTSGFHFLSCWFSGSGVGSENGFKWRWCWWSREYTLRTTALNLVIQWRSVMLIRIASPFVSDQTLLLILNTTALRNDLISPGEDQT